MKTNEVGIMAWGTITAALAFAALVVVIWAGKHLGLDGALDSETPQLIAGMYMALKQCGNVVAGILGFSGLAWSNFYKASTEGKGK